MASKNRPGAFDCYSNAHPDEPMFILLGRDRQAPELVRQWAAMRRELGESPAKVQEALDCADAMVEWRGESTKIECPAARRQTPGGMRTIGPLSPEFALAQLRHAYAQLSTGSVQDQPLFARGLLGPAIESLEAYVGERNATAASKTNRAMAFALRTMRQAQEHHLEFDYEAVAQHSVPSKYAFWCKASEQYAWSTLEFAAWAAKHTWSTSPETQSPNMEGSGSHT